MSEVGRRPRVTVGMPTYNRAPLVLESVRMVLAQSFGDFELIVCDDGSSDDTLQRLGTVKDPRMTVLAFSNRGPPAPLNEITRRARGEFLIILHDHDFFDPELLALSVAALDAHPEAHFVIQGSAHVSEDGVSVYCPMPLALGAVVDGPAFAKQLLSGPPQTGFPLHACAMIRASSFASVGGCYRPEAGWYGDVDLSLRLLRLGPFVHLSRELFRFRMREPGHVLTRDFRLTYDSIFWIYREQIQSHFRDDRPRAEALLQGLRVERRRFLNGALLRSLAHGELEIFRRGLELASEDFQPGPARWALRLVQRSPWSHPPLVAAARMVNRLRKVTR